MFFLRTRILEELHGGKSCERRMRNIAQCVTLLILLFGNSDILIVPAQILSTSDTIFLPYENELLSRDSLKVTQEILQVSEML